MRNGHAIFTFIILFCFGVTLAADIVSSSGFKKATKIALTYSDTVGVKSFLTSNNSETVGMGSDEGSLIFCQNGGGHVGHCSIPLVQFIYQIIQIDGPLLRDSWNGRCSEEPFLDGLRRPPRLV